ncbi:MAG TPA: FAD-dependent oxidoreductase [Acidimicrobiales bacterium]
MPRAQTGGTHDLGRSVGRAARLRRYDLPAIDRTLTRRQVLTAIGTVGGAGAVVGALTALDLLDDGGRAPFRPPSAGDFTLQGRRNGTSVVVLGAGIAGLCCAYELEKAGYAVTVLEARQRLGGRSWTVRGGDVGIDTRGRRQRSRFAEGRYLNAGPARIAQHHTTLDYCRELGVAVEVFVNDNPDAYVEGGGTVRRRRAVRADLDGYVAELLAKALDAGALDAELPADERAGLRDHLEATGVLGSADRGYDEPPGPGDRPGTAGTPDDLATLLAMGHRVRERLEGDHVRDWHQAMPMFQPVGGMDAIVTALAGRLQATVRTGAEAEGIVGAEGGADGVEVRLSDGQAVRADFGICTLPPHLAARLDADWPADVRGALTEPSPFITGKLGLEYDRRFWELDDRIFGGPTRTERSVRAIWYPSHGYLGDGGVVVGAYPFGPAADRFSRSDHDARVRAAVAAGRVFHGAAYEEDLRSSFSVDWRTEPHSEGAWVTWPRYGAAFSRLLEPAGRWWFAGDWASRAIGWQHGAFESARHTVEALHEQALAS